MRTKLRLSVLATAMIIAAPSFAADYDVDKVHSTAHFKVKHMGVSNFVGQFNDLDGKFIIDDDPAKCSFTFIVKAASVATNNKKLDGHIKSPDFLNAAEFANITFKSTKVAKSDKGYQVTGDFTLRGVKKSITVDLIKVGEAKTRQGFKIGFDTTFTINRRDYNVNYGTADAIGDDVTLMIGIEGNRK